MSKEKGKLLIILSLIIVLFIGVLYFSDKIISKWISSQKQNISDIDTKLQVIDLDDQNVYWFPVEFQSPSAFLISNKADALYDGSTSSFTSFKVILGTPESQIRSGTCKYDYGTQQFTGDANWYLEDSDEFVKKIDKGKKAILRFYIPKNQLEEEREYYAQRLKYLEKLIEEISQNQLSDQFLIVPDEICLAS